MIQTRPHTVNNIELLKNKEIINIYKNKRAKTVENSHHQKKISSFFIYIVDFFNLQYYMIHIRIFYV